ncbi:hypothetical protein Ccrd_023662, partial [Cynara cardunculus var. scolymus]
KVSLHQNQNQGGNEPSRHPSPAVNYNGNVGENRDKSQRISGVGASSSESTSPFSGNIRDYDLQTTVTMRDANGSSQKGFSAQRTLPIERTLSRDSSLEARRTEAEDNCSPSGKAMQVVTHPPLRSHNVNRNIAVTPTSNYGNVTVPSNYGNPSFSQLVEENRELRRREEEILGDLVQDLECVRTRCRTLEAQGAGKYNRHIYRGERASRCGGASFKKEVEGSRSYKQELGGKGDTVAVGEYEKYGTQMGAVSSCSWRI